MKTAIEVHNEMAIPAAPDRVWDLLTDVGGWPSWYRACRRVDSESTAEAGRAVPSRWKALPIELGRAVVASARPHLFAFVADGRGVQADRTFTLRAARAGLSTLVTSHETQIGWRPRL